MALHRARKEAKAGGKRKFAGSGKKPMKKKVSARTRRGTTGRKR